MLKGKRTYISIILTALVSGLAMTGVVNTDVSGALVAILSALGLYYRYQATAPITPIEPAGISTTPTSSGTPLL